METKIDVIQGYRLAGQKWRHLGGELTALVCHPTKKVNKAEQLTYLSTNYEHFFK
jgi:hypothetical protein